MSLSSTVIFPNSELIIKTRTTQILKEYEEWYINIINKKTFRDKDEFFEFCEMIEPWDFELDCINFMQHVHPDESVRNASIDSSLITSEFSNRWGMSVELFHVIETFNNQFKSTLVGEELLYLNIMMIGYKNKGINLDENVRTELEDINVELNKLATTYSSNLNKLDDYTFVSKEALNGVDNDFIATLDKSDDGKKYKITTKYDHINMIMPYCTVESTRTALSLLFAIRGKNKPYENHKLLQQSLSLRKRKANLLSYNCYSEFVLSNNRMATSPKQVDDFLQDLLGKLKISAKSDADMISNHFNKDKMESWNLSYFMNLYKKEVLQYDQKDIQEYFPLEILLPKLLGTFEDIFHLKIDIVDTEKVQIWHESVKCYAVYDNKKDNEGELIGHFYMDLYPREGKYGHAAAFTLKQAYIQLIDPDNTEKDTPSTYNAKRSLPISAMVCNFTRPTENKPSLLTFGEVETFFHELGHIFHQLLSKNRFSMFSGTSVERDFVECPSQALENWCYEEEFLTRISSHYKTGKTIPVEIMRKIKENKHLFNGLHYIRQLMFAMYDMKLHSSDPNIDVEISFTKLQTELSPLIHNDSCMAANFGHLMGGYESGYYGYLWSEVYAAEVFQLFKQSGDIFNRDLGLHYRQCILEKGGTETGFNMMEKLLKREPNNKAFMEAFTPHH
jgi:Zn-dependent oligopeptidase